MDMDDEFVEESYDDKQSFEGSSSDDDSITPEEECFMEGYEAADEDEFYDEKDEDEEE